MKAYRGARMTLTGVRGSGSSRTAASNLKGGNVDQTWIWRMRTTGPSWRITDVLIDGRSALYAEKQQYAEILEANKGDVNAVIAYIRRRT
jgi:ABC-type transporter MlaC component